MKNIDKIYIRVKKNIKQVPTEYGRTQFQSLIW